MSFKPLFSKSLAAAPDRLHFAAHSHHLWPDASFEGQVECWEDAARLADTKWDRVMGEVWPEAQRHVAAELGSDDPSAILFASNTHDFLIRLHAACPRSDPGPLRVLMSDGEFHSARRQMARWVESGDVALTCVTAEPFDDFSERFLAAAEAGGFDLIFVSQLLFNSGRLFDRVSELASLARPEGPWVVIDGYHAFMAIEEPFGTDEARSAFFLGGGYKYAMAGEGMAFMHCPPGFGPRPPITGWFAEFDDLTLPPGMVGYASDAMRFMGATFDPSALYRFNAIRRMLERQCADDQPNRRPDQRPSFTVARCARRHGAGRRRTAQSARRRAACPLPRLPQPQGAALVFEAQGPQLHHRRARRCAAHRARPLS